MSYKNEECVSNRGTLCEALVEMNCKDCSFACTKEQREMKQTKTIRRLSKLDLIEKYVKEYGAIR